MNLARHLLDGEDDEFRRPRRCEADQHVDDPEVDIGLRRRLGIAFDEIGVAGLLALERALAEKAVHKQACRK